MQKQSIKIKINVLFPQGISDSAINRSSEQFREWKRTIPLGRDIG